MKYRKEESQKNTIKDNNSTSYLANQGHIVYCFPIKKITYIAIVAIELTVCEERRTVKVTRRCQHPKKSALVLCRY